jgi:hypothetical protein
VSAGGDVAAAREFTIAALPRNATIDLNVNIKAKIDLDFVSLSYVFAPPVLGGQLALGLGGAAGRNSTSVDGSVTVSAGGLTATRFGSISDARDGFSHLYPQASLRWNSGVNNYMACMSGDIPVGTYDSSRLANFGIGHGAIDGGIGYTYFDPKTGHEFSVVTGLSGISLMIALVIKTGSIGISTGAPPSLSTSSFRSVQLATSIDSSRRIVEPR